MELRPTAAAGRQSGGITETGPASRTLIDELIAEQRDLTAVEEFSRAQSQGQTAGHYRSLIPFSLPRPGQQYAFEVDFDKCSGCKACVTACHALNGLDDGEAWREVGTLVSHDWRHPFRQTVPTACHHCVDPACLNGCPVLAYEKDEVTGIVRHLDDQCIGCQYCVMMCPYEVPSYSAARGIVRKCDMCSQRLEVGEAPACVQACPGQAISITIVDQDALVLTLRRTASQNEFLPASPDPSITVPTTRFSSKAPLPANLFAADAEVVRDQPAHWPLVWMLVLTQLGAGATVAAAFSHSGNERAVLWIALAATLAGLGASVLHLGKPSKAWRSFLGLRNSWLSREIVAFGFFAGVLATVTAAAISSRNPSASLAFCTGAAGLIGLLGVFCSAMVYESTRRAFWSGGRSVLRFGGTIAILGLVTAWLAGAWDHRATAWVPIGVVVAIVFKVAVEHRLLRWCEKVDAAEPTPNGGWSDEWSLARSALTVRETFGGLLRTRFALATCAAMAPLLTFLLPEARAVLAAVGFASCLSGELIERYLFFRAVTPPRMPGAA